MSKTHIVWFKRDLRVHDHAPLAAACASGEPLLALYIFEPELWSGPDGTARQLTFLRESLTELKDTLEERGGQLVIRIGEASEIFAQLHRDLGVAAIHTYREGRSGPEAKRNDAVRRWALRAGVSLREQENGKILRVDQRGDWHPRWHAHVNAPRRLAPEFIFSASAWSEEIAKIEMPHLQETSDTLAPPGGRTHGVRLLRRAFVAGDAHTFRDVTRALKQHIGMGTISIREAVQAAERAKRIGAPGESVTYAESLIDRLRDDCERQFRLDERAAVRLLGGEVARVDNAQIRKPSASRLGSADRKAKLQRNMRIASDQLSFDFRRTASRSGNPS